MSLLEVRDLKVSFRSESGVVPVLHGVSLAVDPGEVLGIVGESGSGKSVTMLALMGLIDDPNAIVTGSAKLDGQELVGASEKVLRSVRGEKIAMIFQDPMTSLHPVYTVGWQLVEQLRAHTDMSRSQARARAVELLAMVGIPAASRRIDDYPHQFSGGMRQRVMIAMALSCDPSLLIADEPTTALDVSVQAQILDVLRSLNDRLGTSVLLVTHDLGVVAGIADRVLVMYAGRVVERAATRELFASPSHPYTRGLLASIPSIEQQRRARLDAIPGQPPRPGTLQDCCAFVPRCAFVRSECSEAVPPLEPIADGHEVACVLGGKIPESEAAALR